MKRVCLVAGIALFAAPIISCERAPVASADAAPVKLSANEIKMFKHLPSGAAGVFGGNMFEMQRWMSESAIGKLTKAVSGPEMLAYSKCIAQVGSKMVGSFQVNDAVMAMKFFIPGVDISKMKACADTAKLKSALDPDGKYIAITVVAGNISSTAPYLATDGGVYGAVRTTLGGDAAAAVNTMTRADLEKDIASLSTSTAADNATLMGLLKNLDRKAQMWFAGSAKNSKVGDKLGTISGTMSVKSGLAIDISAQILQASDADKLVSSVVEAKSSMGKLPPAMSALADVVKAVQVVRTKEGVRVTMSVSQAQLNGALEQLAPMMGMMGK